MEEFNAKNPTPCPITAEQSQSMKANRNWNFWIGEENDLTKITLKVKRMLMAEGVGEGGTAGTLTTCSRMQMRRASQPREGRMGARGRLGVNFQG